MLNHPLRQFMFCAPDEGAAAVVVCRASEAHRYTSKPIFVKATAVRTRNLGALEVHGTWASSTPVDGPTVEASRAAYEIRSEEHTSELQSLMRISYAVFC